MNKLLFLGYDESQTNLISELRKRKNIQIDHKNSKISLKIVKKYDLVICYGYRFKINKEIINKYKEIINLHISYLRVDLFIRIILYNFAHLHNICHFQSTQNLCLSLNYFPYLLNN